MRATCLNMVHELAKRDPRVVFIGSDLGPGTLDAFKQEFPDRFFMEGVAEQNIIGMAAGLAMEGFIPYVNTIATFLTRRCYEQIVLDLCLHNLPVRLIANGGGLVYAPLGPTHLAIEDLSILMAIPNMTVTAVSDAEEMRRMMPETLSWPGPIYIRLGKGGDPVVSRKENGFALGKGIQMRAGHKAALITTGVMTSRVLETAEILSKNGIECSVLHLHTVKPLDATAIMNAAQNAPLIVTVEENVLSGGLGSAVLNCIADHDLLRPPKICRIGIPDTFPRDYNSQDHLLDLFGLQPDQMAKTVTETLAAMRSR